MLGHTVVTPVRYGSELARCSARSRNLMAGRAMWRTARACGINLRYTFVAYILYLYVRGQNKGHAGTTAPPRACTRVRGSVCRCAKLVGAYVYAAGAYVVGFAHGGICNININ